MAWTVSIIHDEIYRKEKQNFYINPSTNNTINNNNNNNNIDTNSSNSSSSSYNNNSSSYNSYNSYNGPNSTNNYNYINHNDSSSVLEVRFWDESVPFISHIKACLVLFFATILLGSAREAYFFSGSLYRWDDTGLGQTEKMVVSASCVVGRWENGTELENLLHRTEERVRKGDELILWSEEAAIVEGEEGERQLLESVRAMLARGRKGRDERDEKEVWERGREVEGRGQGEERMGVGREADKGGGGERGMVGRWKGDGEERLEGGEDGNQILKEDGRERKLTENSTENLTENSTENLTENIIENLKKKLTENSTGNSTETSTDNGTKQGFCVKKCGANGVEMDVYLMITYKKVLNRTKKGEIVSSLNKAVVLDPFGKVVINYSKTHLTWGSETNVTKGDGYLQMVDNTPFGKMGVAIGTDMDFPLFIRQAGSQGVDILLESSREWGLTGPMYMESRAIRSVENGFTLFRCVSEGVMGVVEPNFKFQMWRETSSNDTVPLSFTLRPKTWAFYPKFGFLFGYIVFVLSLFYVVLSLGPFKMRWLTSRRLRAFFVGPALVDFGEITEPGAHVNRFSYNNISSNSNSGNNNNTNNFTNSFNNNVNNINSHGGTNHIHTNNNNNNMNNNMNSSKNIYTSNRNNNKYSQINRDQDVNVFREPVRLSGVQEVEETPLPARRAFGESLFSQFPAPFNFRGFFQSDEDVEVPVLSRD